MRALSRNHDFAVNGSFRFRLFLVVWALIPLPGEAMLGAYFTETLLGL